MNAPTFDVRFSVKQSRAIRSQATEILYGGAAGGVKHNAKLTGDQRP